MTPSMTTPEIEQLTADCTQLRLTRIAATLPTLPTLLEEAGARTSRNIRKTDKNGRERTERKRALLDTTTVILLPRIEDPVLLPEEPLITTITLAELTVGPLVATSDEERAAREAHLQQAEADFDPLPFDASAARAFGRVAASLRRSGRKTTARSYDAMLAATAIASGLAIYTCNPGDFSDIDGLEVVAVPVAGGR